MSAQQVFLSYCHRDDEPYGPHSRCWVQEFDKALRASIDQRIGPRRVDVWRDTRRLAGNELFDSEIQTQLDNSTILISVLSQHYLGSDYCRKEFQFFARQRLTRGDLHVGRLSRIVKVYRRAIDRAELRRFAEEPALATEVDSTTGFELFFKDDKGVDRDVLLDPGKTALYWQSADDIALAIKRIVDSSSGAVAVSATASAAEGKGVVYLARATRDLKEPRESMRRELEDRGYFVLPSGEPPEEAEEYKLAVQADLRRARLSVHLLGRTHGLVRDGDPRSGVALQADLALQETEGSLRSIFWAPADVPSAGLSDRVHREFVEGLEGSCDGARAEFVRGPFEQLKALVLGRLDPLTQVVDTAGEVTANRMVYLVCDAIDRPSAKTLRGAISGLGLDVTQPSMEGTPEELFEEHKANLVGCDIVVILWGQSREPWLRAKLRDTSQAPGWGRKNKPYVARVIVLELPATPAKQDFEASAGWAVLRTTEISDRLSPLLR